MSAADLEALFTAHHRVQIEAAPGVAGFTRARAFAAMIGAGPGPGAPLAVDPVPSRSGV